MDTEYSKYCVLIVGPSGSGKSTLENELVNLFPDLFHKTISLTTREPRVNEVDGIHYHFVQDEQFHKITKVESIEFLGIKYGLAESEFTGTDKNLICVVEPTGCGQIIDYMTNNFPEIKLMLVYFDIPTYVRLANMTQGRGDDADKIKERMEKDKIKEQFELRQDEFCSKVSMFYRITNLTNHIPHDIMSMLYDIHTHTYFISHANTETLDIDHTWSYWDENTDHEINRSRIIYANQDRIICHLYGEISKKYKQPRELYKKQILKYIGRYMGDKQ